MFIFHDQSYYVFALKIVTFCVNKLLHRASKIVTFWDKLLHFVSKVTFRVKVVTFQVCYILRQKKLLHFALMLHFASVVTFCGVTLGSLGFLSECSQACPESTTTE